MDNYNVHQIENKCQIFFDKNTISYLSKCVHTSFVSTIGRNITLFENKGLSNYLSLANRFFDYIQAGIPQLCVNYPAYRDINNQYDIAILIDDLSPETISNALNLLASDRVLYERLKQNCLLARKNLNWQEEEKKLICIYLKIEK
jgi:glycosyltransferase involved in cell wall biosynthesis